MRSVKAGERAPNMLIEILKGGLLASVISIVLIVLYALALWKEILPASSMPIANAVIKVLSAAVAALLAVRRKTAVALWRRSRLTLCGACIYGIFHPGGYVYRFRGAAFRSWHGPPCRHADRDGRAGAWKINGVVGCV